MEVFPATDPAAIDAAIGALWAGGIVGIPTDTVYGIAVLPLAEPLQAVLVAKQRPAEKGIALMVDSIAQIEAFAVLPPAATRLAERFWPGPLTLVLEPLPDIALPSPLYGITGRLGFRVPDHPVPRAIAARIGPIAVTSANVSGEPDSLTAGQLVAAIGDSLSLVLDGGPTEGGVPSTVVAVEPDGTWTVLREGALTDAAIRDALA
ncbi:MAG: L-threonylcarbamoyladenylate synthase [Candidatus Limnocylindrales bacterium]